MMTLLDVLDCSFSDSFVQRFSAPEYRRKERNDAGMERGDFLSEQKAAHLALPSQPTP